MVALTVLFATGVFEHNVIERTVGMDPLMIEEILAGRIPDEVDLIWNLTAARVTWWAGVVLLWVAAVLTLVTGFDYYRKALPQLHRQGTI